MNFYRKKIDIKYFSVLGFSFGQMFCHCFFVTYSTCFEIAVKKVNDEGKRLSNKIILNKNFMWNKTTPTLVY